MLLKENAFSGVRSRRERTTDVFLCDDLYSLYCNSLRSVDAAYAYPHLPRLRLVGVSFAAAFVSFAGVAFAGAGAPEAARRRAEYEALL